MVFNSSRKYLEDFIREAAGSIPKGSRVLDAGAGDCIYKAHFAHAKYESADFCQGNKKYGDITYVCDLSNIPVEDNRYDLILLTQVLEHIPDPQSVLNELKRVLVPGGTVWLTVPLFYAEHESPHDYYRYTRYGIVHILEKQGFSVRRLEWLEGYCGTLSYQLRMAASELPVHPGAYGGGLRGIVASIAVIILKPLFTLLAKFFARLDVGGKVDNAGMCKNYCVIAQKPL